MGDASGAPLLLVVDDDEALLQLYRDLFQDEGYRLAVRTYPAADLADVRRDRPDAILLDLLFGQENAGWRFLERLKTDPRTAAIPVVVATADHRLVEQEQERLAAWCCGVVLKPFDIDDLASAVGRAAPGPSDGQTACRRI
jgi:CheY-like chemotaxis protein